MPRKRRGVAREDKTWKTVTCMCVCVCVKTEKSGWRPVESKRHTQPHTQPHASTMNTAVQRLMVTGTRAGMTAAQKTAFIDLLNKHESELQQLLHGDCIGADAECHKLARDVGGRELAVHVYPPKDERQRAWCQVGDTGELVVHRLTLF